MKTVKAFRTLMISCALVAGVSSRAAVFFDVDVDTSGLIGQAQAPFSLDFQFLDGSAVGDVNNTVVVSGFSGGTFNGSPVSAGGASSSSGVITLTDSSFFNEFSQPFTPGTFLRFSVSLTTAVDSGGTPDQFSFAILDKDGTEIPTLGLGDAFFSVNINSANPAPLAFGTDLTRTAIDVASPTIAVVPEPGSYAGVALFLLLGSTLREVRKFWKARGHFARKKRQLW
jgi:hypothetical protein